MEIKVASSLAFICEKLEKLLDICFPLPPRNVFYLTLQNYKNGDPVYYAIDNEGDIIGFVYCSKNSKGGVLENIAVHPNFRNKGLGARLVDIFLNENKGVITLTTRIPEFFRKKGFIDVEVLPDKSIFMYMLNF